MEVGGFIFVQHVSQVSQEVTVISEWEFPELKAILSTPFWDKVLDGHDDAYAFLLTPELGAICVAVAS